MRKVCFRAPGRVFPRALCGAGPKQSVVTRIAQDVTCQCCRRHLAMARAVTPVTRCA